MLALAAIWAVVLGVATQSLIFPAFIITGFALALSWASYAISLTGPEHKTYNPDRRAMVLHAGAAATAIWVAGMFSPLIAGSLEPWLELAMLPALVAAVLGVRLLLSVPFPPRG